MNELIASSRPRRNIGLIDKLRAMPAPLAPDRAERFHQLHARYEAAVRREAHEEAATLDNAIDKLLTEARNERQQAPSNVGQVPADPPAPISFDGGVRRPVTRRREPLSMADAIRAELDSRAEIRERNRANRAAWTRASR